MDGFAHDSRWEAAEPLGESLGDPLDKLESVVTAQDAELRRTRTELELRNLYVAELHAVLKRQAEQLEQLARRLDRLESGREG